MGDNCIHMVDNSMYFLASMVLILGEGGPESERILVLDANGRT